MLKGCANAGTRRACTLKCPVKRALRLTAHALNSVHCNTEPPRKSPCREWTHQQEERSYQHATNSDRILTKRHSLSEPCGIFALTFGRARRWSSRASSGSGTAVRSKQGWKDGENFSGISLARSQATEPLKCRFCCSINSSGRLGSNRRHSTSEALYLSNNQQFTKLAPTQNHAKTL